MENAYDELLHGNLEDGILILYKDGFNEEDRIIRISNISPEADNHFHISTIPDTIPGKFQTVMHRHDDLRAAKDGETLYVKAFDGYFAVAPNGVQIPQPKHRSQSLIEKLRKIEEKELVLNNH